MSSMLSIIMGDDNGAPVNDDNEANLIDLEPEVPGPSGSLLNQSVPSGSASAETENTNNTNDDDTTMTEASPDQQQLHSERLTGELIDCIEDVSKLRGLFGNFYKKACKSEKEYERFRSEQARKLQDAESRNEVFKEELYKKIYEALEQDLNCSICSELFIQPSVLDCGHTFCAHCIGQWRNGGNRACPICRQYIFRPVTKNVGLGNFLTKFHSMLSQEIRDHREQLITERTQQQQEQQQQAQQRPTIPGLGALEAHHQQRRQVLQNQMEALRQQSITSQGPSASGATPPRPGSTQALLQPQRELTIRPGGSILVAAPPVSNSAAVAAAIAAVSGSTTVPTTTTPAAPGHYPIVYGSSLILNPGLTAPPPPAGPSASSNLPNPVVADRNQQVIERLRARIQAYRTAVAVSTANALENGEFPGILPTHTHTGAPNTPAAAPSVTTSSSPTVASSPTAAPSAAEVVSSSAAAVAFNDQSLAQQIESLRRMANRQRVMAIGAELEEYREREPTFRVEFNTEAGDRNHRRGARYDLLLDSRQNNSSRVTRSPNRFNENGNEMEGVVRNFNRISRNSHAIRPQRSSRRADGRRSDLNTPRSSARYPDRDVNTSRQMDAGENQEAGVRIEYASHPVSTREYARSRSAQLQGAEDWLNYDPLEMGDLDFVDHMQMNEEEDEILFS